jgi:hypothetical protein
MNEFGNRAKHRAMTLAELIIGLCLFSLVIIPMFGIIPTAYTSIKKAEDYSSASCYAQEIIESYRAVNANLTIPYDSKEWDIQLNSTDYHVLVGLYGIDSGAYPGSYDLIDVVVNLYRRKIPQQFQFYSRIYYNK